MHVIVLQLHVRHEGTRLLGIFTSQDAAQDAARNYIAADEARTAHTWRKIVGVNQWAERLHEESTLTIGTVPTNCMLTNSN